MVDPVARELRAISKGASLADVFEVLARCGAPVAGSVVVYEEPHNELVVHSTLPRDVVSTVLTTAANEVDRSLGSLVDAPEGTAFVQRFSDRRPVRASMRHGLSKALVVKLSSRRARGDREVHVLTVRAAEGASLRQKEAQRLAELAPEIRKAIDRVRIPIVREWPMLEQVIGEQRLGFAVVTEDGEIVEVNRRAYALAPRYVADDEGNDPFGTIVHGAMARAATGAPVVLRSLDGASLLDVAVHTIATVRGSVHLVLAKEIVIADVPTARGVLVVGKLTSRQREAAMYLVDTGLPYRSIADAMGVSEGTLRKHVEFLYRSLRVHSRAELAALLK